jgi:photosynthetic reaction center cytochrome c subunit
MALRHEIALLSTALFALSCTHAPATSAPAPGSASVGSAGSTPAGQPARPPRRIPPSRDSLAKLRAVYVAQVMSKIAGRENEPAEKVFENVQVLKGITAAQLVHKMDKDYAEALSWNCTNCHRFAPQGNFASDTSTDKKRARFMQQMTNEINLAQLPKLYPKQTPVVTCATCHRGYNEPPPGDYLAPERGKPGAPVPPTPPGRGGPGSSTTFRH